MYESTNKEKKLISHTHAQKRLAKVKQLNITSEVTTGFGLWSKGTLVYLY